MCTKTRTKTVTVGLALVALLIGCTFYDLPDVYYNAIIGVFHVALPVTVLVINVLLIREVRRAANSAAANLGLQQHHQSTSSNSAVPTVMVIATSLIYVLFK